MKRFRIKWNGGAKATRPAAAQSSSRVERLRKWKAWWWSFRMTQPGQWMFLAFLASAILGSNSLQVPVYLLVCAWTAFFVCIFLLAKLLRPRVSIRGAFPAKARTGQTLTATFQLTNTTRRPQYNIGLGFAGLPDCFQQPDLDVQLSNIEPNETETLPLRLKPLRRGIYTLPPLRPFSAFPLNLFRSPAGTPLPTTPLIVLPHFEPVSRINIPLGARYQPGGIALTSHIGESPEYIGNREYRPGDPLRHIDFRSWARLAKPVVREYQEEYYHRIALLVDTYVPGRRAPKAEGFPHFEAAVSLSAAIADAMSRGEYVLDIFAAGPELYVFRTGRNTTSFENVLEILAGVDVCRTDPFEKIAPALAEELHNISAVLCVFLDWDNSRKKMVQAAVEAGCSIKIIVVRDGDTTLPINSAEVWTEDVTQYSVETIRSGGLEVI